MRIVSSKYVAANALFPFFRRHDLFFTIAIDHSRERGTYERTNEPAKERAK